MKGFCAAFVISSLIAAPALAGPTDAGQPFLVIESGISGSILDYFDLGRPSGLKQVSLRGTVTQSFGAPSLLGIGFTFQTDQTLGDPSFSLTLGAEFLSSNNSTLYDTSTGYYDFDPFAPDGPGDLNFKFLVSPGYVDSDFDPVTGETTFDYTGSFAEFGPRRQTYPEFEMLLSVFLNGPIPMRLFEELDPVTGAVVYSENFIEGPLSIRRMTLGTIGGPPVATVPLPASALLLGAGLLGLGVLRRKRRPA